MGPKISIGTSPQGKVANFRCPGCENNHQIWISGAVSWVWNGSIEAPTFGPSLLVMFGAAQRCHSFICDGKIEFLTDSTHALAGQTVDLPDWRLP